jgi:hypothetical protein
MRHTITQDSVGGTEDEKCAASTWTVIAREPQLNCFGSARQNEALLTPQILAACRRNS